MGVFLDFFFSAEKRDNKQKQNHHRSGINNDLDDRKKFCVIKKEQKGQANHVADQIQGTIER